MAKKRKTKVKRRPGGGRKVKDDDKKKLAIFSTRISIETRAALDQEAKRRQKKLSPLIEELLVAALNYPAKIDAEWRGKHHLGLGRAVARLAYMIELGAGLRNVSNPDGDRWLENAWAARALRAAVNRFLQEKTPSQGGDMPDRIKDMIQGAPPELAATYKSPEAFGVMIANSLISDVEEYEYPRLTRPANEHYADIYFDGPMIRNRLAPKEKGEK